MFVCRGARLWAKALEQGLNSTTGAAEQLQTNRLTVVDIPCRWPARTIHTFKCSGAFGGYIGGDGRTNEGQSWRKKLYVGALEPVFTPGANVCNRRLYPTLTVQMRPFSSVAVAPKRVEDSPADHKVDQTPKQAPAKGPEEPEVTEPEEDKPSKTQQLKKIFKEYGAVGVSFHICMSLMSLGMFYLAVSSGIDMAAILYKIGFSESLVQSKLAAGTSTFVLAYAIHKLFAPLRISITVISVPLLVRYLRKSGLFKTPNSPTH